MSSDRPKVGDAFRASAVAPDRTAGLAGLLPPAPARAADDRPPNTDSPTPSALNHEPQLAPTVAGESPQPGKSARGGRRRTLDRTGAPAADDTPATDPSGAKPETRIVSVALDASVLTDLRTFAARTEQTHGAVTLRAIEAHAEHLARHWSRPEPADPAAGRLFAGSPAVRRRTEPVVQTQLRFVAADTDTLDRLVQDWAAPSRSAVVNEALSRYVRPSKEGPS